MVLLSVSLSLSFLRLGLHMDIFITWAAVDFSAMPSATTYLRQVPRWHMPHRRFALLANPISHQYHSVRCKFCFETHWDTRKVHRSISSLHKRELTSHKTDPFFRIRFERDKTLRKRRSHSYVFWSVLSELAKPVPCQWTTPEQFIFRLSLYGS